MTINEVPERVVLDHKTLIASNYDKVIEAFKNMHEGRALSVSFDNDRQVKSAYVCLKRRFKKMNLSADLHLRSKGYLLQIVKVKR